MAAITYLFYLVLILIYNIAHLCQAKVVISEVFPNLPFLRCSYLCNSIYTNKNTLEICLIAVADFWYFVTNSVNLKTHLAKVFEVTSAIFPNLH